MYTSLQSDYVSWGEQIAVTTILFTMLEYGSIFLYIRAKQQMETASKREELSNPYLDLEC
jgi:hypothetical protein